MMLNRLLTVPGVEQEMLNIGVNLCLLVLSPRGSGVARESHNERSRNTLKHSTSLHKWWETLKGSIFGVKPSIPALREPGYGLVVAPVEKASVLASQFDSKLFVTSLSCFPRSAFNSLAFRISDLLHLLLDLDTYGGVSSISMKVADIIAPKLSIIFRRLIGLGWFPKCWHSANVTAIPKGTLSPDRENYRPISITPILSKVNDK